MHGRLRKLWDRWRYGVAPVTADAPGPHTFRIWPLERSIPTYIGIAWRWLIEKPVRWATTLFVAIVAAAIVDVLFRLIGPLP